VRDSAVPAIERIPTWQAEFGLADLTATFRATEDNIDDIFNYFF
jgi:hypothetical protein